MIITCPNCNKQFKIDNTLIPDEGRDLQCGSCNHIWFYNIKKKNNELLEVKEEIISDDIEIKAGNDKENDINKVSDLNKEYLYMKENAIHFINSYFVKKFDDENFIVLITNCKDGFWHVEYKD